jgi:tRNA pseudouridine(38-40) synthase
LFKKNININVAGRTDAKVHAFRQVFSFKSNKTIPINNLSKALNKCLP